jgi:poly-beta-1,6-N-acetyl-D-glucosamine synthase
MIVYLSAALYIGYAILLDSILTAWRREKEVMAPLKFIPTSKISVIIAYKDEADNIAACIDSILKADYPAALLEIIAVDDSSIDNSYQVVTNIEGIVCLKNDLGAGKKWAIKKGISYSHGSIIACVDADCTVPKNWLKNIACHMELYKSDVIAGLVAINKKSTHLRASYESFDMAATMAITSWGIKNNYFYLANGANIAYKKTVYESVNGHEENIDIASGDDVFLINSAAEKKFKISFLKSKDSIVYTLPQPSWSALFGQRKRWAAKTSAYANNTLYLTQCLIFFANVQPFLLLVLSIIFYNSTFFGAAVFAYIIKCAIDQSFINKTSAYFGYKLNHIIILEFIYASMMLYMGIIAFIPSKYEWKGRRWKK